METREQDITDLFQKSGIDKKVVVATNEHMYTLKDNIEDNWLFYTFFGFKELNNRLVQEGKAPKRMAIIGTGNGVDALGAYFTIDGVEELLITDIDPRVMKFSVKNIQKNIPDGKVGIYPFVGDLCKPILERGLNADLVYGNLPNLPSDSDDLSEGLKLSSLYRRENSGLMMPSYITSHLLEMQRLFLDSAKDILNPGGSVLPIIGGRVPYELFQRMFADAGFNLEELCSGFKRQTEPDIVIPEYASAERDWIIFSFYPFTESKEHLKKLGVVNPTTKIDGMELSNALRDYRISATEALSLYREGIEVGHTVHFFRGIFGK